MVGELIVTENEARYLKLIYRMKYEAAAEVRTSTLARIFGVRPATVTEVIRNLSKKDLLVHMPYRGIELTSKGIEKSRELLRKHRILEIFFADFLRYNVKRSCLEASKIDYYVSKSFINDICRLYGHPRTCPCKKDIFADPSCLKKDVETK